MLYFVLRGVISTQERLKTVQMRHPLDERSCLECSKRRFPFCYHTSTVDQLAPFMSDQRTAGLYIVWRCFPGYNFLSLSSAFSAISS